MKAAAFALLLAACGSTSSVLESQPAKLGDLRFEAPDAWSHSEVHEGSRLIARWLPADNPNKVVISVIRSELRADHRDATPAEIETMLAGAQHSLPHAQIGATHELHTARGLSGFEVEDDFVPPGQRVSYHRIHAVLLDGPATIHVLYTSRSADAERDAFRLVLDSIRREEG